MVSARRRVSVPCLHSRRERDPAQRRGWESDPPRLWAAPSASLRLALLAFVSALPGWLFSASAVAHPLGFATGDLYLDDRQESEKPVELELVVDVPEDELETRTGQADGDSRDRLTQRIRRNVQLLQAGQPLPVNIRVLVLGQGASAVDVVRLQGMQASAELPLSVAIGPELDDLVMKVHRRSTPVIEQLWVKAGETSQALAYSQPASSTIQEAPENEGADAAPTSNPTVPQPRGGISFAVAVRQGFAHILPLGLDHVVFILGLFFLATRVAALIVELSIFTLAHSITLALGTWESFRISGDVVEPMIALSIVLIGLEPRIRGWWDTDPRRRAKFSLPMLRLVVIFAFGLLHGLGFASVFRRVGGEDSNLLRTLLGFNIGVELGQLAVVAIALVTFGPFRARTWYVKRVVPVACTMVAVLGGLWFLERVLA